MSLEIPDIPSPEEKKAISALFAPSPTQISLAREPEVSGWSISEKAPNPFGFTLKTWINREISRPTQARNIDFSFRAPNYIRGDALTGPIVWDFLKKDYATIFPHIPQAQMGEMIHWVHRSLFTIIQKSQPKDLQKDIQKAFLSASDAEKLILANTLGTLLNQYTYNNSTYSGQQKYLTANNEDVLWAFQQAVRTGKSVEAGMCIEIHTLISQTLHSIGIPSVVISTIQSDGLSREWVKHGVSFHKIGNIYVINDYGKNYIGRTRDEVVEKYEKVNKIASIRHYITDADGKIVGTMQTPRWALLDTTFASRTFESFMTWEPLPDGVVVEAYSSGGQKVGGIEVRKHFWPVYIQGKSGKTWIPGTRDTLAYRVIWLGIEGSPLKNVRISAEANAWKWSMTFSGEESLAGRNNFFSASAQVLYSPIRDDSTQVGMWLWASMTTQYSNSTTLRDALRKSISQDLPVYGDTALWGISEVNAWMKIRQKISWSTTLEAQVSDTMTLGTQNLGDPNKWPIRPTVVDHKISLSGWVETRLGTTGVAWQIGMTSSNTEHILDLNFRAKQWLWDIWVSLQKVWWKWDFGSPNSTSVWASIWYDIDERMRLKAEIKRKTTPWVWPVTSGGVTLEQRF